MKSSNISKRSKETQTENVMESQTNKQASFYIDLLERLNVKNKESKKGGLISQVKDALKELIRIKIMEAEIKDEVEAMEPDKTPTLNYNGMSNADLTALCKKRNVKSARSKAGKIENLLKDSNRAVDEEEEESEKYRKVVKDTQRFSKSFINKVDEKLTKFLKDSEPEIEINKENLSKMDYSDLVSICEKEGFKREIDLEKMRENILNKVLKLTSTEKDKEWREFLSKEKENVKFGGVYVVGRGGMSEGVQKVVEDEEEKEETEEEKKASTDRLIKICNESKANEDSEEEEDPDEVSYNRIVREVEEEEEVVIIREAEEDSDDDDEEEEEEVVIIREAEEDSEEEEVVIIREAEEDSDDEEEEEVVIIREADEDSEDEEEEEVVVAEDEEEEKQTKEDLQKMTNKELSKLRKANGVRKTSKRDTLIDNIVKDVKSPPEPEKVPSLYGKEYLVETESEERERLKDEIQIMVDEYAKIVKDATNGRRMRLEWLDFH